MQWALGFGVPHHTKTSFVLVCTGFGVRTVIARPWRWPSAKITKCHVVRSAMQCNPRAISIWQFTQLKHVRSVKYARVVSAIFPKIQAPITDKKS